MANAWARFADVTHTRDQVLVGVRRVTYVYDLALNLQQHMSNGRGGKTDVIGQMAGYVTHILTRPN